MIKNCKLDATEIFRVQQEVAIKFNETTEQLKNPVVSSGHLLTNTTNECQQKLNEYREELQPIELEHVLIQNKVVIVRLKQQLAYADLMYEDNILEKDVNYILIGEIAQKPGYVIVQSMDGKMISNVSEKFFEVVPPHEL